jgi:hypothetical protein
VTVFSSIGTSLLPGVYTQELAVRVDTCSVRIDFNNFTFNQPIRIPGTSGFTCGSLLDVLKLTVLGIPIIDLPDLCGELSGQHIYLPIQDIDETLNSTELRSLNLTVVYLALDLLSQVPLWNITLTQLPCPDENDLELPPLNVTLPPIGCLQYFTEVEGVVESFNFLNGLGRYLNNLTYAICFQRYPDTCGIKLLGIEFDLAINGTEQDCDTLDINVNVGIGIEKLLLPEGVSINGTLNVFTPKSCGNALDVLDVNATVTLGPLYIGLSTDGLSELLNPGVGFQIEYELLSDCQ